MTGEEVSERHARSVLVGILDPVTRQHTAMNHSKSHEALKKIVQEFANDLTTTSQEAMQSGRVEAGATAPTIHWPPLVAVTSEDSWEEYGAINAMGSQPCKGYGHVSRDCPNGKGKGKGNFGKGKGAYEWGKSNYDGNKDSNYGMCKGGGKANIPSSCGPVVGYQKNDGNSGRVPQSSSRLRKTIEPDHVKAVNADDGWEDIEFALDFGATETMMGGDMLSSVEIKEGAASKRIDCDLGTHSELGREEVSGRPSRGRDPEHHCPGMRSKQGPDEREEGDAGWQPSDGW